MTFSWISEVQLWFLKSLPVLILLITKASGLAWSNQTLRMYTVLKPHQNRWRFVPWCLLRQKYRAYFECFNAGIMLRIKQLWLQTIQTRSANKQMWMYFQAFVVYKNKRRHLLHSREVCAESQSAAWLQRGRPVCEHFRRRFGQSLNSEGH